MTLVIRTTGVEDFLSSNGEPLIKALIMGEPSAGKTRSASFWPSPIFADCERGRMSLADRQVPFAEVHSSADMDGLLKKLEVMCKTTALAERPYKTLVIDTVDAFQKICIQEILRAGKKEALSGYSDWGQLDAKMTNLVQRLLALPMNVVANLHIKHQKNGEDGPLIWTPRLKGDISDSILEAFDLVGHMSSFWTADGGERVLKRAIKWTPEPTFPVLKDRSGQLPGFTPVAFTDDDYLNLLEAIYGDYFDALKSSEDVDEVEDDDEDAPVEPHPGGPVTAKPAKKATAKAEAAPIPEDKPKVMKSVPPAKSVPAARTAPPAAKPPAAKAAAPTTAAAPPPAAPATARQRVAPRPDFQEPAEDPGPPKDQDFLVPKEAQMAQAEQVVAETLGGTVVADTATGEVISDAPPAEADPIPTAGPALPCGTPAKNATKPPAPGCGKDISAEAEGDLVNIALIKTSTYLCPDCLAKWRATNKK